MLNNLYKRGGLQTSFAGNLMAVLDGGRLPEQLTLRRALEQFIEFRVLTVQRRAAYELRRAEARLIACLVRAARLVARLPLLLRRTLA